MTKSPKTDRLREMREAKAAGLKPRADEVFVSKTFPWFEAPVPKDVLAKVTDPVCIVCEPVLDNDTLTSLESKPCETNKPSFDKRAYQRELMRKRRAKDHGTP